MDGKLDATLVFPTEEVEQLIGRAGRRLPGEIRFSSGVVSPEQGEQKEQRGRESEA
uniref:Uncharacterized protein n=1 Tax=Nelumbo nucifera TaxID=4432 RepID=A0A822XRX9_NELNU|nr:TPA_asm: hypothetical protein HUJ06_021701 [Nelumbo nucifera]